MQLLRQKIELAPDRTAVREKLLRLCNMRDQTIELLADVGFGSEQDRLLVESIGVEALGCLEQRRHLFGEACLDGFRLAPRGVLRPCGERRDFVEPPR